MARHFPYLSAGVATALVGAITSVVWAAQVPHPPVAVGAGPSIGTRPVPNLVNTPGTGPAALPPGFQQSAAFGSTGMSQAGQPPFGEMFYSVQTYMNQPGQPDYYDRLGMNPTAIQASEGVQPTPPNSIGQHLTPTNTGTAVGFYNGFGPGNPNFGFYAGFTTPR
jgi:hypothetical protein